MLKKSQQYTSKVDILRIKCEFPGDWFGQLINPVNPQVKSKLPVYDTRFTHSH